MAEKTVPTMSGQDQRVDLPSYVMNKMNASVVEQTTREAWAELLGPCATYTTEGSTGVPTATFQNIWEAHRKLGEILRNRPAPPLEIVANAETLEDIRRWAMSDLEQAANSGQIESTLNTIKLIEDNTLPRGEVRELYVSPEALEQMQADAAAIPIGVARQIYEPQVQYIVRLRQDQSILYSGPSEAKAREYVARSGYLLAELKLEHHRLNLNNDCFITEIPFRTAEEEYSQDRRATEAYQSLSTGIDPTMMEFLNAMPTGGLIWGGPDLPYTYFGPAGSSSGPLPWYQIPAGT